MKEQLSNRIFRKHYRWLKPAADTGNAQAQVMLGSMHANGQGVKKDYTKAFNLLLSAAKSGNVIAQMGVASYYFNGLGVEQNYKEAFKWV